MSTTLTIGRTGWERGGGGGKHDLLFYLSEPAVLSSFTYRKALLVYFYKGQEKLS